VTLAVCSSMLSWRSPRMKNGKPPVEIALVCESLRRRNSKRRSRTAAAFEITLRSNSGVVIDARTRFFDLGKKKNGFLGCFATRFTDVMDAKNENPVRPLKDGWFQNPWSRIRCA